MLAVQQVSVIKIGTKPRQDGHRTMKAWRYEQGAAANPVETFEFGNHGPGNGATAPGKMVLRIPVASIYHPTAAPGDFGPNAHIDVDLFYIRRIIENILI